MKYALGRMTGFAKFALLTIIDGEKDKITDFKILVFHFGSDGSNCTRSFVTEDGWVWTHVNFTLLEDQVLGARSAWVTGDMQRLNSLCDICRRTSCQRGVRHLEVRRESILQV